MTRYRDACAALERAPERWLVTGAAGFIGSALVERLLALGQEVVGLDNFATGHRANLVDAQRTIGKEAAHRFTFVEGDIAEERPCQIACQGVKYVLHQAALGSVPRSLENPLASHRANVDGFLQVILAARDAGVVRFVFASSSSVYGDHPDLPKVEQKTGKPLSPYAATKQVDEIYADVVQKSYGLQAVGLRYFNVFGRRQDPDGPYAAVIPRWLDNLFAGRDCTIFGDGKHSRDFCYVDNAVQANILAALSPAASAGTVYNVGCGDRTDLATLHALLCERVGVFHPPAVGKAPLFAAPRAGDVPHSQADISKIRQGLGYQPSHDIAAGLTATVEWFARNRTAAAG